MLFPCADPRLRIYFGEHMNQRKIATHSGKFHADDVFSVALFKHILPSFDVFRTRDSKVIGGSDIVIDVGCEYNPDTDRFDHHQRGGAGKRENGIPYSSFGLIWKKYGLVMCGGNQEVANFVDRKLVANIDAVDCGYVEGEFDGVSLSQIIALFNPMWNEKNNIDACFDEAVNFASRFLERFIASAIAEIEAEKFVFMAIKTAKDPRVFVLNSDVPWKQAVHALSDDALFAIYPSPTGHWRIHAVPIEPGSFSYRKLLPEKWAGLSGDELRREMGVNDAVFCHDGRFTAGTESLDGAMRMVSMALGE